MAKKVEQKQKLQRFMSGVVTSLSGANTIRIRVEKKQAHPLYKKIMASHKSYAVHVEDNSEVKVGDVVEVVPTRPMSKTKSWKLNNIVESAE